MKLPRDVEQKAVRDSLLSAQRMADFDRESAARKAGLRWYHDYLFGFGLPLLVIAWIACAGFTLYFLFNLLFG